MKYIIVDWANNPVFGLKKFKAYDDAWDYLLEKKPNADDDELGEFYVVTVKEFNKTQIEEV